MITNADMTIFNSRYQAETRSECYIPTVIRNISAQQSEASNVNGGIWAEQSVYKIRIPFMDAEIENNRDYVPENQYRESGEVSGYWTIRKGDIVILGIYDGEKSVLSRQEVEDWAKDCHYTPIIITEYADNTTRGSDAVRHWRIGGK